jgi:hypothetical protein
MLGGLRAWSWPSRQSKFVKTYAEAAWLDRVGRLMLPESLLANGRFPSITIMPTETAFLTQLLVITHTLKQPAAFHVHNFCWWKRPFTTQTTRHLPKPQQTSPRHNFQNLRQNQIAVRRTGADTTRRKVGRSGAGRTKLSLCLERLPAD